MQMKQIRARVVGAALLVVALAALGLAGSASAKLTGEFTKFQQCPYTNATVERCLYSVTESGEVVLGNKKVPIEKAVTLQAGFTEANEKTEFSKLVAATNGITLSKTPQSIPGGLAGIVPEASSPPLVKALIKFFFENSLTGVNSTLELAVAPSEVLISESHLAEEEHVALKMPVKVHLENPFLGKNCYVGSSSSPLTWELTTGTTSPVEPNKPIKGKLGLFEFLEEARILKIKGLSLVDNAWSAPTASGCGGILSFLVTPIINAQLGTTTKGHNTAILSGTTYESTSFAVKKNNEEHP
jgi:hypothetical protein